MIKKSIKRAAILLTMSVLLSSCYSYTTVVGDGGTGNEKVSKWNHYLVAGLAPIAISDSKKMADGAENYTVRTRKTFVNGLVSGFTLGIYTPTKTTVTK